MFKAVIDTNRIVVTNPDKEIITSGSVNVNFIQFSFSEDWADLQKTVLFQTKKLSIPIILEGNSLSYTMPIPWEVLLYANESINVGAYGTRMDDSETLEDEEIVLPTVWGIIPEKIRQGVIITDPTPSSPTYDAYQRLLKAISDILENGVGGGSAVSPVVTVKKTVYGHLLTITDVDGEKTVEIRDGENGLDSLEYIGPIFDDVDVVDNINGTVLISAGDLNRAPLKNEMVAVPIRETDGAVYQYRLQYARMGTGGGYIFDIMASIRLTAEDGVDGFSPIVSVTEIDGGHKVTITDSNGPKSFNVMDGGDADVINRCVWIYEAGNDIAPFSEGNTNVASPNEFIGHKPTVSNNNVGLILVDNKLYWVKFNITAANDNSVTQVFTKSPILIGPDAGCDISNELITIKNTNVTNVSQLPDNPCCIHAIKSIVGFNLIDDIIYVKRVGQRLLVYTIDGAIAEMGVSDDGTLGVANVTYFATQSYVNDKIEDIELTPGPKGDNGLDALTCSYSFSLSDVTSFNNQTSVDTSFFNRKPLTDEQITIFPVDDQNNVYEVVIKFRYMGAFNEYVFEKVSPIRQLTGEDGKAGEDGHDLLMLNGAFTDSSFLSVYTVPFDYLTRDPVKTDTFALGIISQSPVTNYSDVRLIFFTFEQSDINFESKEITLHNHSYASIRGARGATGTKGDKGDSGDPGPEGPAGPVGLLIKTVIDVPNPTDPYNLFNYYGVAFSSLNRTPRDNEYGIGMFRTSSGDVYLGVFCVDDRFNENAYISCLYGSCVKIADSENVYLPGGGTTGQVLAKASSADGDVVWKGAVLSETIKDTQAMTEEEYAALDAKSPTTLYIIPEE